MGQLRNFAAGSAHARFMIAQGYHSAVVAPLVARRRTLGAFSVLRLGEGAPYAAEDFAVVCELARHAALAIDNARLFSEVRGVEQRLEAILLNLAEAITLTDAEDRIVFANQAAAQLLGASGPAELMGSNQQQIMERLLVLDEHGRELAPERMPRLRLFAGEPPASLLVRIIVRATGEERWLIARPAPIDDPESGALRYSVNVYEDITEVKRVQMAESFMAEASQVLASSMDYAETLTPDRPARGPRDRRLVRGRRARGGRSHRARRGPPQRPLQARAREELDRSYRPSLEDRLGVAKVIRSGHARLHTLVTPEGLAAHARDSAHLGMLERIGDAR